MAGFFNVTELPVIKTSYHSPQCGRCGLYKTCNSPKMEPSGKGRRKILVVAEAPGATEDLKGVQLVGNSGARTVEAFDKAGVDMRNDCTLTNALICRPPNNKITNSRWVDYCRPNVIKTIERLKPEVVVLMGSVACDSVLGWLWKENVGGVNRWAGFRIPDRKINAWVCPTFHPSFLLHEKSPIYERLFDQHIEAACELRGRPWKKVTKLEDEVEVITSPKEAARRLASIKDGDNISFDFEATCLKPDAPTSELVCCGVCVNGKETFAFPWHGEAIRRMKLVLQNPRVGKIGWNAKFEHRWCHRAGIKVRGWKWDGMLAAHAIYNGGKGRPVTGLKFQAYVHLGVAGYDEQIGKYLVGSGGYGVNTIKKADLEAVMLYCGADALLEYRVSVIQKKELESCTRS